jgi:cyclopropane fatty-acyl-phospholipid synthase-like methyltransferase
MNPLPNATDYFAGLYRQSDDPWLLRDRWYERRKRALTLAALPDERYPNAYEPGCANGELTVGLAARCEALLATDLNEAAVELTRRRVRHLPHVRVERRATPEEWPDAAFDLIVVSEMAYYLDDMQLAQLADTLRGSLEPGGTVIACHWRRPIEGWPRSGDFVHEQLRASLALPSISRYTDDDMVLDVWSSDQRSVHQREARLVAAPDSSP